MTIIAPSILSCDFLNIEPEIKKLDNAKDIWIHLDIMDGHFVPNLTFGPPVMKNLSKITKHKLDAHFMVTNPELYADECEGIGLHNFTFHWEAVTHHDRFISYLKEKYPSVGISLNPSTPINVIPTYLFKKIDLVLIMSVNPGFGGQSFIDGVIDKVRFLSEVKKNINPNLQIQIDGGVKDTNSKQLIDAGATNLVAGSYVFGEPNKDYIKRIDSLRS
jgi:ribulose-phosphate 3-epimerase